MKQVAVSAHGGKRLLAFIIDILLLQIITNPIAELLSIDIQTAFSGTVVMNKELLWITVFLSIIWLLYFTLFEYWLGATPGMRLFKLHLRGPNTVKSVLLRNLFTFLFFPFTLLWIIEPFMVLFKNIRLQEKISHTETYERVKLQ